MSSCSHSSNQSHSSYATDLSSVSDSSRYRDDELDDDDLDDKSVASATASIVEALPNSEDNQNSEDDTDYGDGNVEDGSSSVSEEALSFDYDDTNIDQSGRLVIEDVPIVGPDWIALTEEDFLGHSENVRKEFHAGNDDDDEYNYDDWDVRRFKTNYNQNAYVSKHEKESGLILLQAERAKKAYLEGGQLGLLKLFLPQQHLSALLDWTNLRLASKAKPKITMTSDKLVLYLLFFIRNHNAPCRFLLCLASSSCVN